MSPDKLVRMANQIALFFRTSADGDAPAQIANHLNQFWAPRMRAQLLDLEAEYLEEMDALVRASLPAVRRPPAQN